MSGKGSNPLSVYMKEATQGGVCSRLFFLSEDWFWDYVYFDVLRDDDDEEAGQTDSEEET